MRTFNVSFLAVLSCVAMIGATPIGNRSPFRAVRAPLTPLPDYPLNICMDECHKINGFNPDGLDEIFQAAKCAEDCFAEARARAEGSKPIVE